MSTLEISIVENVEQKLIGVDDMKKYNVWMPYKLFVVKEVEAENEEEAIEKAMDETDGYVSLCYQCMTEKNISDDPYLIEDEVSAEER